MNTNQVKGVAKEVVGTIQKKTGELTGSVEQQVKGLKTEAEGKLQKKVGDAQEVLKDAANGKRP